MNLLWFTDIILFVCRWHGKHQNIVCSPDERKRTIFEAYWLFKLQHCSESWKVYYRTEIHVSTKQSGRNGNFYKPKVLRKYKKTFFRLVMTTSLQLYLPISFSFHQTFANFKMRDKFNFSRCVSWLYFAHYLKALFHV